MTPRSAIDFAIVTALTSLAVLGSERFPVRRIYCVGRDYLDHIREMKETDERDPPFFFQKPTDAPMPEGATVPYPPATNDFQFEVELVAAIGRGGQDLRVEDAEMHIYGYAIGIDITRRDRQRESAKRGLPWEMGKLFDHSAPCGPIHQIASYGVIRKGAITLSDNGQTRQKGDIANMIWNVPEVIANLSTQYELCSGDLIFTETPAGVGPVVPGDHLECAIDGLGTLRIAIGSKKGGND